MKKILFGLGLLFVFYLFPSAGGGAIASNEGCCFKIPAHLAVACNMFGFQNLPDIKLLNQRYTELDNDVLNNEGNWYTLRAAYEVIKKDIDFWNDLFPTHIERASSNESHLVLSETSDERVIDQEALNRIMGIVEVSKVPIEMQSMQERRKIITLNDLRYLARLSYENVKNMLDFNVACFFLAIKSDVTLTEAIIKESYFVQLERDISRLTLLIAARDILLESLKK